MNEKDSLINIQKETDSSSSSSIPNLPNPLPPFTPGRSIMSLPDPFSELPKNIFQSPLLRDAFPKNITSKTGLVPETSRSSKNSSTLKHSEIMSALSDVRPLSLNADAKNHRDVSIGTPQSVRIVGEVAFTPTHSAFTPHISAQTNNPHASMIPQTPVASGPSQAKNSIKLQNCVSTVNLSCELKLLDIYCRTRHSEYNPSRFNGVIMRILEPKATALIFRSGKVVCTGTKNEQDSLLAARKFSRIIQKLGYPVRFVDFKMQNFVATADLRFPIKLESLQQAHGQFTSYEPELFPGLVYRMIRPRIVLLIFVNGKIVFTGAKSQDDIIDSLNIIYPILKSFKKN